VFICPYRSTTNTKLLVVMTFLSHYYDEGRSQSIVDESQAIKRRDWSYHSRLIDSIHFQLAIRGLLCSLGTLILSPSRLKTFVPTCH
jgi:hypothetical protein